jgi:hypothetical protein
VSRAGHKVNTKQHAPQPGAEAGIVIPGAPPLGEPVTQEMVIAVAFRPAEDISDETQACEAFGSLFARRGRLGTAEGLVGFEFVGVDARRGFAVGLIDVVEGR